MASSTSMARIIESPSNPLVKSLVALKDRRARDRTGTFLVEGARECMRALSSDLEVLSFLHAPGLHRAAGPYEQLHGLATDRVPDVVELSDVALDRKSTRLNSSHVKISYAVFCLKKK